MQYIEIRKRMFYFWFFSWLESQSSPSYRPSPLVAQVAWMYLQEAQREAMKRRISFKKHFPLGIPSAVLSQ